jgi:C4-dicarboxylate transporter DctM subunit
MIDAPPRSPAIASLVRSENAILSIALAAMAILPLAEMALRGSLGRGIPGAASLVQHLTLIVGMMGAAIAARDDRLLAIAGLHAFLKGRPAEAAHIVSNAVAAAVAAGLCYAAYTFVASEYQAGKQLIHGLPVWVIQAFLPLGFALIGIRLLWNASPRWSGRAIAVVVATLLLALVL